MSNTRNVVASLKPYVPGKPTEELKRELGIKGDIIKIASNENPLGPSPLAIEAISAYINNLNIVTTPLLQ